MDYSMLGSISRSPYFGKLPYDLPAPFRCVSRDMPSPAASTLDLPKKGLTKDYLKWLIWNSILEGLGLRVEFSAGGDYRSETPSPVFTWTVRGFVGSRQNLRRF